MHLRKKSVLSISSNCGNEDEKIFKEEKTENI